MASSLSRSPKRPCQMPGWLVRTPHLCPRPFGGPTACWLSFPAPRLLCTWQEAIPSLGYSTPPSPQAHNADIGEDPPCPHPSGKHGSEQRLPPSGKTGTSQSRERGPVNRPLGCTPTAQTPAQRRARCCSRCPWMGRLRCRERRAAEPQVPSLHSWPGDPLRPVNKENFPMEVPSEAKAFAQVFYSHPF